MQTWELTIGSGNTRVSGDLQMSNSGGDVEWVHKRQEGGNWQLSVEDSPEFYSKGNKQMNWFPEGGSKFERGFLGWWEWLRRKRECGDAGEKEEGGSLEPLSGQEEGGASLCLLLDECRDEINDNLANKHRWKRWRQ